MDLRGYMQFMRRWWWLLVLCPVFAALPIFFWMKDQAPTYRATATIFVNQSADPNAVTYNDALLNQQLVKTYALMAPQPIVIDQASQQLGYPIPAGSVTAQPVTGTQLLQISAVGGIPTRVRDIANEVASVFIARQAPNIPQNQVAFAMQVAQPALLPIGPMKSRLSFNLLAAAAVGLVVAIGIARLIVYFDDTIKTATDLEHAAGLMQLGAVNLFKKRDRRETKARALGSRQLEGEAYRRARTLVNFALFKRGTNGSPVLVSAQACQTILVTSASPREGRSTTVANLGMAMAEGKNRVIIIDADLLRPTQHRLFGLVNAMGLSDLLLSEEEDVDRYLFPTQTTGLRVLPSGPIPEDPVGLLTSGLLTSLLAKLRPRADFILIDSPPVLAVSDALELSKHVDGTIIVVDTTRTRAPQLRAAAEALNRGGTRILGAILNKLRKPQPSYRGYYAARLRAVAPARPLHISSEEARDAVGE